MTYSGEENCEMGFTSQQPDGKLWIFKIPANLKHQINGQNLIKKTISEIQSTDDCPAFRKQIKTHKRFKCAHFLVGQLQDNAVSPSTHCKCRNRQRSFLGPPSPGAGVQICPWDTADAEIKGPPWWEPRAIKGSFFLSL